MARPPKNTADYFPHQVHWGKTIPILEARYGNDGYAVWFKLLEMLGATAGHYLDLRSEIEREFFWQKCRVTEVSGAEILACLSSLRAIDPDLWELGIVWSQNFVDGLDDLYRKRRIPAPEKPDCESFRAGNASAQEFPRRKCDKGKERKGEERKGKESSYAAEAAPLPVADSNPIAEEPEAEEEVSDIDQTSESEDWAEGVREAWNRECAQPGLPFARADRLSYGDMNNLANLYRVQEFRDGYGAVFKRVAASSFLRTGGKRGEIFCTLGWVLRNENFRKIIEGKYDDEIENHNHGGRRNGRAGAGAGNPGGVSEQTRRNIASIDDPDERLRYAGKCGVYPDMLDRDAVLALTG